MTDEMPQMIPVPIGAFVKGPRMRIGPEERVQKPFPLKRVVILGMGFSLWDYIYKAYGEPTDIGEPGVEVWGMNYAGWPFRVDRVFNMHDFEAPEHAEVMKGYLRIPETSVVSIRSYDWLPNSWEFPLQEVLEDGLCGIPYLKNTTSYAVAFAILCRVQCIDLYGCDFDYDQNIVQTDKFEQGRANLEFWLGKALAYGINVNVAPSGTLLGASSVAKAQTIEFYGYGAYKSEWEIIDGKLSPNWLGFRKEPKMEDLEKTIEPLEPEHQESKPLVEAPPATDEFVAVGSSLFSDPTKLKQAAE